MDEGKGLSLPCDSLFTASPGEMDSTTESSGIEKSSWKIVPSNAFSACFIPFALLIPLLNVGDDTSFSGTVWCAQFSQVTPVSWGKELQLVPSVCLAVLFRCQVMTLCLSRALDSALNWGLWRQHTETETRARICRYRCISVGRGRRGKAGCEDHGDRTGDMHGAEGRRGQRTGCPGGEWEPRGAVQGGEAEGQWERWGKPSRAVVHCFWCALWQLDPFPQRGTAA